MSDGYVDVHTARNIDEIVPDIVIELKYIKKKEYKSNKRIVEEKRIEGWSN